jgi:hypothetical protein
MDRFSALIFAYSVKSFLLYALAFWSSYKAYYYTFYISGYIESALVLLTLIECGRQVLPGLNLPQKEKAFAWLGAALAAVLIFTAVWPLPSIAQERRIEVGAYLGIAAVFHLYRRLLALPWTLLVTAIGGNDCHPWLAVSG